MSARRIFIRDLICDAMIGVHPHEKKRAQKIHITIDVLMADMPHDDLLANTICYEHLAELARAIAAEQRFNLAESLAARIADACLTHSQADEVRVILEKPAALKDARAAGVEIRRKRR